MAQHFDDQTDEPDAQRPRAARPAQYILIAAIMALIAAALITFH
jgi:hypothetical protein